MHKELEYFAEVDIGDASTLDTDVVHQRGAVIGKSRDEETQECFYTVMIYDLGEAVVIPGMKLQPTGRIVPRDTIFSGESRRVIVDPKTGDGQLST